MFAWSAFIIGPPDSPYSQARFELSVKVPSQYPLSPPEMKFVTKVCHPNVHFKKGDICLDILKEAWTPVWTLESACRAVIALLGSPDADSPLNCDAGNLLRDGDLIGFESLARMYTLDYATILPGTTSSDMSNSSAKKDKDA